MRSSRIGGAGALAGALVLCAFEPWAPPPDAQPAVEIVATGISRPLQLALDGRILVVLSPGTRGDTAAEISRVDLEGELPVDLARQPALRIPFAQHAAATLGSLAIPSGSRDLYLGEENGARIFRMGEDGRLVLYATGLTRLAGSGGLSFDAEGRLLVIDYVFDPRAHGAEDRPPPGLEQFKDEDYRGPLVFRLTLDPQIPLPRRLASLAPLFPRGWGGRKGGGMLPRLLAVAPLAGGDLLLLGSGGHLYRLTSDGAFTFFARLPTAQYDRISMVTDRQGGAYVSGGFHTGRVFHVSPAGAVTTVASGLADPEGIVPDGRGWLYVAESAQHRVIRLRP
ncbi:MAG: hypothetical protein HY294_00965 [Candidatus Rokubacteria bacterium]|nr:hypothetical protein [Candidatus Rokubacteria bacterium]MBI3824550.1 hypothetical protein [Candidatus Rokubacteria bacterium]